MSDLIDNTFFRELTEDVGEDFVPELVAAYRESVQELADQLSSHLAARDREELRKTAHSIGSTSASIGAFAVMDEARRLEHGVGQFNWSWIEKQAEVVAQMVEKTLQALSRHGTEIAGA